MRANRLAAQAYQSASDRRNPREQEAEVFLRVAYSLRAVQANPDRQAPALADNFRLWLRVGDLARHPDNILPAALRAQLVSVSRALQREMARPQPDLDFLISVNESIAAGLSSSGVPKGGLP